MYNTTLEIISTIIIFSTIIPLTLFVYFFSRSRWEATEEGRTIMLQTISWIALVIFLFVSKFFGSFIGRIEIGIFIYTFITFLFWKFLFNLRRIQKQSKETKTAPITIIKEKAND